MENIKANELRIGNFYDHNGFVNEATPNTIEEVWIAERSWVKPIPLTEEWLLKFGFEKKVDEYVFQDFAIEDIHEGKTWCMKEFDYADVCYNAIGKGINYVHQLQNLYFALTGEELTFKSE